MTGWDRDSVARSIRRYFAMTLPDEWTLRTERREIPAEERPVAVVELGQETIVHARETLEQGETESLYPVTVSAYPEVSEDERSGSHAARQLASQLHDLILRGVDVVDGDGRNWAGPFRIPLWDYSEKPVSGLERAGEDVPHDVLFVVRESLNTNPVQDPDDTKRWGVFCEFRVTVESPGREREAGRPLVTKVPGEWRGDPPGVPSD
jgi:hypothetical protein